MEEIKNKINEIRNKLYLLDNKMNNYDDEELAEVHEILFEISCKCDECL